MTGIIFLLIIGILCVYGMVNRMLYIKKYPFRTPKVIQQRQIAVAAGICGFIILCVGMGLYFLG
ncbi:hypothetical protein [Bacillus taeanensis]|uniref:Uncharacterized protein n=1 Tax=Bacillus taeanensis TaxID=273032 RepID=A0A366XZI0_9BACI|nr:hypothetical protein [Bacillus taeanensis]RBW69331.1 hypothetical protein DS031_11880 [Bacillus taeanensis]